MIVGVTGATGFVGRYIVQRLVADGHHCRCWYRESSNRSGFEEIDQRITWVTGQLGHADDCYRFAESCDAIVHAAFSRPGRGFQRAEGELTTFVRDNVQGTIELIEEARVAGVKRFVFVSSCAVHDQILSDRRLDEAHPLWPHSHYGAYKAAIEAFVSSYGRGEKYSICAVRPTGVYGVAHPFQHSKWYPLVRDIVVGLPVKVKGGGKEVHAADVAQACSRLLVAEKVSGEVYNCCDRYISHHEVAMLAREIAGSQATIQGEPSVPQHQIDTDKIQRLGVKFGGDQRLRATVEQLVKLARE